jgi:acylphosphatase
MAKEAAHILVSGRVQGVGYRAFTERTAKSMQLTGWVRNLEDSRVETSVEGERAVIDAFIERLKVGPRYAEVKNVEVRTIPLFGASGFEIRR